MTAHHGRGGVRWTARLRGALKKIAHLPRDAGRAIRRRRRDPPADVRPEKELAPEEAAPPWTEGARRWRAEIEPHPWRALVVGAALPAPDRDSSSIATLELMRGLQSLGYVVTFVPSDLRRTPGYAEALIDAGFWCLTRPEVPDVGSFLRDHGALFDVVFLCRTLVASHVIDAVQTCCPDATLVFQTMGLEHVREEREASLLDSEAQLREAETKRLALDVARRADAVLVHSTAEKELLAREAPEANVFEVPYAAEPRGGHPGFEGLVTERPAPAAGRALLLEILRASGTNLWCDRDLATAEPPRARRPQPGRAVFPSRFMRELHAAAGVEPEAFEIVPHGVVFDHAPDAPRADRAALVEPGALRLLFAGRVTHYKGVHTAVAALPAIVKAVPHLDVVLTLVGDTSDARYIESIRRQIEERGLAARVRWEPTVAEDRLFELFQRHDVYVFPSLFEPFALTLILALEAGIPTVATATGGNVDLVVDHATGLLFPPGDATALADRVAELAANPLLRRELSQAGRAAAARLTADAMITRLEACLERAARRSAAGVGT